MRAKLVRSIWADGSADGIIPELRRSVDRPSNQSISNYLATTHYKSGFIRFPLVWRDAMPCDVRIIPLMRSMIV